MTTVNLRGASRYHILMFLFLLAWNLLGCVDPPTGQAKSDSVRAN